MKKTLATIITIFTFSTILIAHSAIQTPTNGEIKVDYTSKDVKVFNKVVKQFSKDKDKAMNEFVIDIAKYFLETPYVAGTLENTATEALTINLRETDCILFVEMCTALAHTIKGIEIGGDGSSKEASFELYCDNIRNMRYIDGMINGYASRQHYTSGWILQNEKNGIMKEISKELGSPLNQEFSFMSSNPQSYKQLQNNNKNVAEIIKVENFLSNHDYYYLSNADLKANESKIKSGDIICFVSVVDGLDISHVAFAYWTPEKELHFIHASSKAMKVIIEPKTLVEYTRSGIRLMRF